MLIANRVQVGYRLQVDTKLIFGDYLNTSYQKTHVGKYLPIFEQIQVQVVTNLLCVVALLFIRNIVEDQVDKSLVKKISNYPIGIPNIQSYQLVLLSFTTPRLLNLTIKFKLVQFLLNKFYSLQQYASIYYVKERTKNVVN